MENNNEEIETPESSKFPEELTSILSDPNIPEESKEKLEKAFQLISLSSSQQFSGPLPPPMLLAAYDKSVNNGAERIMTMAENQSAHRIEIEKIAVKEELRQSSLGQIFGFILGLVGIGAAVWLALEDHDTVAGIFGTTTICGLVAVFVIGRKKNSEKS